jgi:DMSO/TMAO reductase YedYZ molybdopterin-dependent catalytic subunit
MKPSMSRRGLLSGAVVLPPTFGSLIWVSDALTFATHRFVMRKQPLAREFSQDMITRNFPLSGTRDPEDAVYQRHKRANFTDWRLPIGGLVERPREFSLAELKALPARTQITMQACEEGWSAIGEWTGARLSAVLASAGMKPEARWVVFHTVDGWWDSLDLFDALHEQTLLAYGMNGGELPVRHGAPIRLRVERQLGYKSLKFVNKITVTDRIDNIGDGTGSGSNAAGFSWYAGI